VKLTNIDLKPRYVSDNLLCRDECVEKDSSLNVVEFEDEIAAQETVSANASAGHPPSSAGIGLGVEVLGSQGIVLVVDIFPESPAANEKMIQIGDHLLEVDGHNVTRMEYNEIYELVSGTENSEVNLKFLKSSQDRLTQSKAVTYCVKLIRKKLDDTKGEGSSQQIFQAFTAPLPSPFFGSQNNPHKLQPAAADESNVLKISSVPKASPHKAGGVGLLIRKDGQDKKCYVQSIIEGGSAFRNGNICVGDKLLEVNGNDLSSLTIETVVQMISGPEGSMVTLKMESSQGSHTPRIYVAALMRSFDGYSSYKGGLLDAVSRSLVESFMSGKE
jgi:C-terminal processing protease CtpA/Prc